MNTKITTAVLALALPFAAPAALANEPVAGRDACVVGTWVQTGGGPGEWMKARMPNQQVQMSFEQGRSVMVLQGDGRYTAQVTDLAVEAIHKDPAGFRQRMRAQVGAAGHWSTRNRQLLMEAEAVDFTASNDAVAQAAQRLRDRHARSPQRGRVFYGCQDDHLTTRTEVRPGETFPTHFVKVRGNDG
jgi:hypothetical protein